MKLSIQDIDPPEALRAVFREIKHHQGTGRKNFVIRVPVDLIEYLFSGVGVRSGMSKVKLERQLAELKVSGFGDADGRVLRRYLSGQSRMAWDTFQRLVFWAFTKGWISDWVFRDLLMRAHVREAAQLSARKIINRLKRQVSAKSLNEHDIVQCFDDAYLLKQRERDQGLVSRLRVDSSNRELARLLGFDSVPHE
ncbi:hypothetical protein GTA07_29240 [Rhodococcus hoagii]|nr:hypothetical protein [Prescottella equi]